MSDELKCYECVFRFSGCDHRYYVIAETHEEASKIFEDKKYWQWKLVEVKLLGKAFNQFSEKVLD